MACGITLQGLGSWHAVPVQGRGLGLMAIVPIETNEHGTTPSLKKGKRMGRGQFP